MSRNLKDYIPKIINVGPYKYTVLYKKFAKGDESDAEIQFNEKKIYLSSHLDYNLGDLNYVLTIESLLHEILHGYNFNIGLHSELVDLDEENVEEYFTDLSARHFIQMLQQNPSLIKLLNLINEI